MYVKKLKRKCSVRGCKNTDTFAISLTREVGNTVIICKSCLGKALGAIDDIQPEPEVRVSHTEAPALFFNNAVRKTVADEPEAPAPQEPQQEPQQEPPADDGSGAPTESGTSDDTATPPAETSDFVCPHCGQVCKSELGLQKHIAAKHKDLA